MCFVQGGRTALFMASSEGHAEVVRALLQGGAAADSADEVGGRPHALPSATLFSKACCVPGLSGLFHALP